MFKCERMKNNFGLFIFLCLFVACELLEYSPIFMREKKIEINPENDKEQENRNDDIPKFNEISCMKHIGFKCIKATFPNGAESLLITKPILDTSILQGYVQGDEYIKTLIIDIPKTKKRLIFLRSENFPLCYCFDIDLLTSTTKCVNAQIAKAANFIEDNLKIHARTPSFQVAPWSIGPIIPLSNYYRVSGIPFKALFLFDLRFQEEFESMDGKSGAEHMETASH